MSLLTAFVSAFCCYFNIGKLWLTFYFRKYFFCFGLIYYTIYIYSHQQSNTHKLSFGKPKDIVIIEQLNLTTKTLYFIHIICCIVIIHNNAAYTEYYNANGTTFNEDEVQKHKLRIVVQIDIHNLCVTTKYKCYIVPSQWVSNKNDFFRERICHLDSLFFFIFKIQFLINIYSIST